MGPIKTTFRGGKLCGCAHDPCDHSFGGAADAHTQQFDHAALTTHPSFNVITPLLRLGHWSGHAPVSDEQRDMHATVVRSARVVQHLLDRG